MKQYIVSVPQSTTQGDFVITQTKLETVEAVTCHIIDGCLIFFDQGIIRAYPQGGWLKMQEVIPNN